MELAHDLIERVGSKVLAHERTVPVGDDLAELFPERALVRGRTLACAGPGATSAGMALAAAAVAGGAWLAVVDIPTFGLDAASEAGIPLERVVAVSTSTGVGAEVGAGGGAWIDVMGAVVDGFDLVLARVPVDRSPGLLRKLSTRIRQRGAVVILLGDVGAMACDGVVDASGITWTGLGAGFGVIRRRSVELQMSGRFHPMPRPGVRLTVGEHARDDACA